MYKSLNGESSGESDYFKGFDFHHLHHLHHLHHHRNYLKLNGFKSIPLRKVKLNTTPSIPTNKRLILMG